MTPRLTKGSRAVGDIDEALDRAGREAFTRQPPTTLKGQVSYLMKQLKTARAVAAELGITADSVNRYRRGARKHPPQHVQERIDDAVRSRWQPLIRKRRRQKAAATDGITVETRARFGYTAPVGTTDDGRFRRLTVHLPRSTHAACSRPENRAPATSSCATSSRKDCRRCTSRTVAGAPRAWKSPLTTSTTLTSPSDFSSRPTGGLPHRVRLRDRARTRPGPRRGHGRDHRRAPAPAAPSVGPKEASGRRRRNVA